MDSKKYSLVQIQGDYKIELKPPRYTINYEANIPDGSIGIAVFESFDFDKLEIQFVFPYKGFHAIPRNKLRFIGEIPLKDYRIGVTMVEQEPG